MARAVWNDQVIAEGDDFEIVEGNVYFSPATVHREYLRESPTTTICGWKGTANYYTLVVDGRENPDAAWYYREPKAAAERIKDHVAFWHGVEVER